MSHFHRWQCRFLPVLVDDFERCTNLQSPILEVCLLKSLIPLMVRSFASSTSVLQLLICKRSLNILTAPFTFRGHHDVNRESCDGEGCEYQCLFVYFLSATCAFCSNPTPQRLTTLNCDTTRPTEVIPGGVNTHRTIL
jgi:hypothetical protein